MGLFGEETSSGFWLWEFVEIEEKVEPMVLAEVEESKSMRTLEDE